MLEDEGSNGNSPPVTHFRVVAKAITEGRVVPFFGAGVNLSTLPAVNWGRGPDDRLPSGEELTDYLATQYSYPTKEPRDLARVSQYVAVMHGLGTLYEDLHHLFTPEYKVTPIHDFFASLQDLLAEKKYPVPNMPWRNRLVIVTTNYDDLMERAFGGFGVKYHLLSYVADLADRRDAGRFVHRTPEGDLVDVEDPDKENESFLDKHPVIIKIHGYSDRLAVSKNSVHPTKCDSYVITEDDYIDYLSQPDPLNLIPPSIRAVIQKSSFLFLGYGLRDWNFRVILRRIWRDRPPDFPSWAVLLKPTEFDKRYWRRRDVEILDLHLARYVSKLREQI
jgi:hypothetical protein